MNISKPLFAEIIVPVPVRNIFTYVIPDEFHELSKVGCRVIVPFGKNKIYTGIIVRLHEEEPETYAAREIIDILDAQPLFNTYQIHFYKWLAEYYMSVPGEVLKIAMPAGLKISSESKIQLNPKANIDEVFASLSDQEVKIIEFLEREETATSHQIEELLGIKSYNKYIRSLVGRQLILLFDELKDRYSPKKVKTIHLHPDFEDKVQLNHLMNELDRYPKQLDVLLAYLREVPVLNDNKENKNGISKKALVDQGVSPSSLKTLVKNKVFIEKQHVVDRFDLSHRQQELFDLSLSEVQQQAMDDVLRHFQQKQTVLLHGVTGSGKTAIYIELIKNALAHGGQVLYLLPEIALTTQLVERLAVHFGSTMGVYHSKYSDNERVEVWKGLVQGRFNIIVGVRSSIFLPYNNLELVIVDEEHENTYKQYEPSPRYHARDAAQVLAGLHHAKVLMGTATPSVESMHLAQSGKYGYVKLDQRFGTAELPEIKTIDLGYERKIHQLKGDISKELNEQIATTLQQKEQVIIFQNRRGYSPLISCQTCGWIPQCHQCSVSLTYHIQSNQLSCHYCGYSEKVMSACPQCGSVKLKTVGFGTEKLEEDLKLMFPKASVERMDLDTTRSKYSYETIINAFSEKKIDILVGTQMVTKGLDFDHVSLVGVMDFDSMLHFPDFRSFERTFQLVTQVGGRAGRKDKAGKVLIQTQSPGHFLNRWIINNQQDEFYAYELHERQKFGYPPFVRLILVVVKHKEVHICEQAVKHLHALYQEHLGNQIMVGPSEPVVSKIRNYYIRDILFKVERDKIDLKELKKIIIGTEEEFYKRREFRQTIINYDVDPL